MYTYTCLEEATSLNLSLSCKVPCVYACIHTLIHIHFFVYICVYIYMYKYIRVYIYMCVYICANVYMYTYMYICINMQMYTCIRVCTLGRCAKWEADVWMSCCQGCIQTPHLLKMQGPLWSTCPCILHSAITLSSKQTLRYGGVSFSACFGLKRKNIPFFFSFFPHSPASSNRNMSRRRTPRGGGGGFDQHPTPSSMRKEARQRVEGRRQCFAACCRVL